MRELQEGEFMLPPRVLRRVREVTLLMRHKEFDGETTDDLGGAFVWKKSPEGLAFWVNVSKGDYSEFDRRYPTYTDSSLEYDLLRVLDL
jgi:hypothetical protein